MAVVQVLFVAALLPFLAVMYFRKHTNREEKVKLDKEAHQDAMENVKLDSDLRTKHVLDYVIHPE